jgi:hypothetical protein
MAPAFLVALLIQDAPLVTEERPRIELLWTLDQLGRVNESCTQFAVSPDGKWLTLWSGTGHFMLWEVSTGKLRQDKEE